MAFVRHHHDRFNGGFMSAWARRSMLAATGLALIAGSVAPTGPVSAAPGAAATTSSTVALARIRRGLKVVVATPPSLTGRVKVVVKGPKGWKKTVSTTKTWKKAKPGKYRIIPRSASVNGLDAVTAVAPGARTVKVRPKSKRGTVKAKVKNKRRGAQARVTYSVPLRCSASGAPAYALGGNAEGQLGAGTRTDVGRVVAGEVGAEFGSGFGTLRGAKALGAGTASGYAVCADGGLWSWGSNSAGQLGSGSAEPYEVWPSRVESLTNVVAVAGGDRHALALLADGTVWSWGANEVGQLGNGSLTRSPKPVQVSGLTGAVAIAAGDRHGYALLGDGTVRAWGADDAGQIGNGGGPGERRWPTVVQGLSGVVDIAAGSANGYALLGDGTVRAWGSGASGALGNDATDDAMAPVVVTDLEDVTDLGAGHSTAYAVLEDGAVAAWGSDVDGALGDGGAVGGLASTATPVPGLGAVKSVVSGGRSAYALRTDGSVAAWGAGHLGQLGNGVGAGSAVPVLAAVGGVTEIAAGGTAFYVR
jgi:alpha-tubulin suppressor-like RCC1 family protein